MSCKPENAVDIQAIVAAKGGKLPSWVNAVLKKLLHLDYINEFLVQGYEGVEFCTRTLEYLDIKLDVSGLENVPADGTLYTFASNHPLGGIDGVALGSVVGENFGGKIKYLVNDFLMLIKGLAPMCVGINKTGGQSRQLPRQIAEAFASDNHMLIFPAGLCSRRIDGKIQDIAWSKAFITKSVATGRSIVPVHFIARNSNRFYRVASLNKKLGIKFNIAMALLPDEMCKAQHSTFRIVFGNPIPPETFDSSRTPVEWAQWVREKVYELQ